MDINRAFHLTAGVDTFFSRARGGFSGIDRSLGHKTTQINSVE